MPTAGQRLLPVVRRRKPSPRGAAHGQRARTQERVIVRRGYRQTGQFGELFVPDTAKNEEGVKE